MIDRLKPYLFLPWVWIPVCALTGISRFDTNDDPIMLLTVAQGNRSIASEQLVFINVWIGYLLKYLYNITTVIPWYTVVLACVQAACLTNIVNLINSRQLRSLDSFENFTFNIIFVTITGVFFLNLQFTQVAILCGVSGTVGLLLHEKKVNILISIALLFLGLSARIEGGIMGAIMVGLATPFVIITDNKIRFFRIVLISLLVVAFYFKLNFFWGLESPFLSDSTRDYLLFNRMRGKLDGLGGYTDSIAAESAANGASLTSNDWELFRSWYFADPKLFTTEKLKYIVELRPKATINDFTSLEKLKSYIQLVSEGRWLLMTGLIAYILISSRFISFSEKAHEIRAINTSASIIAFGLILILSTLNINSVVFLIKILCIAVIIFLGIRAYSIKLKFSAITYILLLLLTYNIFLYLIFVLGRLPNRVLYPAGLSIFLMTIILCRLQERARIGYVSPQGKGKTISESSVINKQGFKAVATACFTVLCIMTFLTNCIIANNKRLQSSLSHWSPDKPIVAFPSLYTKIIDFEPYANIRRSVPNWNYIIPLGTTVNSPSLLEKIEKLGLDRSLLVSVLNGKAFLGVGMQHEADLVYNYLCQHYNARVVWDSVAIDSEHNELRILKARHDGVC